MAIEVGKKYYFFTHAYHHFVCEVVEVIGKHEVRIRNVARVQSCPRPWTEFFKDGFKNDTNYEIFPDDGEIVGWFAVFPWHHPIPKTKKKLI
jgi:hypothetical protein